MKVYVVTEGDYSDYHIVGLTTERKKAEEFVRKTASAFYEPCIEKYDTDDFVSGLDRYGVYDVEVLYSGEVIVSQPSREDGYDWEQAIEKRVFYQRVGNPVVYKVTVAALDEEHAKKIGLDKIAEYKYRYKCEGAIHG